MAKIKGNNVRIYIGGDMLAHTDSVTFNFNTDTEEVTDADSGNHAENLPTTNNWDLSADFWYNNSVSEGKADFDDALTAQMAQTELTVIAELETGKSWSGLAYITNLTVTGGTAGSYVKVSTTLIGTGEIS